MDNADSQSRLRQVECVSIGYQGKSPIDLCSALEDHGVELVIDVRQRAWSYRPQYRKGALTATLRRRGIQYVHAAAAGNPFRPGNGHASGYESCAEHYREWIMRNPLILRKVHSLLTMHYAAVMCYEANSHECHRSVLLEVIDRCVGRVLVVEE